jgi:hypothetical protein
MGARRERLGVRTLLAAAESHSPIHSRTFVHPALPHIVPHSSAPLRLAPLPLVALRAASPAHPPPFLSPGLGSLAAAMLSPPLAYVQLAALLVTMLAVLFTPGMSAEEVVVLQGGPGGEKTYRQSSGGAWVAEGRPPGFKDKSSNSPGLKGSPIASPEPSPSLIGNPASALISLSGTPSTSAGNLSGLINSMVVHALDYSDPYGKTLATGKLISSQGPASSISTFFSRISPATGLSDMEPMVTSKGYSIEKHQVTTTDGCAGRAGQGSQRKAGSRERCLPSCPLS